MFGKKLNTQDHDIWITSDEEFYNFHEYLVDKFTKKTFTIL